jgi:hypothetical protein
MHPRRLRLTHPNRAHARAGDDLAARIGNLTLSACRSEEGVLVVVEARRTENPNGTIDDFIEEKRSAVVPRSDRQQAIRRQLTQLEALRDEIRHPPKPDAVACPRCGQPVGAPCLRFNHASELTDEAMKTFHRERTELAARQRPARA